MTTTQPDREYEDKKGALPDAGAALLRGTAWSLLMRWGIKLIGMVSMLILARLLAPADYGLMAMAMLVIGLVQVFLDASADTALLRHPEHGERIAHSAWTLRLLQSLAIALAIAVLAPLAALYFREPRVQPVMWVLAGGFVITGLGSVGPILARRELDFVLEVRIGLLSKLLSFALTLGCALWWRNYWALVVGQLVGQLAASVLSYRYHPYRPRVCFAHVRELWSFSQWLLISGIANYVGTKLDELIAGRVGTPRDLGHYRVSAELGMMVSIELGAPLSRALLPVLAAMQGDLPRMREALMKTVGAVNTVTLPAGIGLAMLAEEAVPVLLGAQWAPAAPLLRLFAAMGAVRFIVGPYYTLFTSLGRSGVLAAMGWLDVVVFCSIVWPSYQHFGFVGLAYARFFSLIVAVVVWLVVGHANGLLVPRLLREIWRPALGAALMAGVLAALPAGWGVADLCGRIAVGAAVYAIWIVATWRLTGCPDGLEARLLDVLKRRLARAG